MWLVYELLFANFLMKTFCIKILIDHLTRILFPEMSNCCTDDIQHSLFSCFRNISIVAV